MRYTNRYNIDEAIAQAVANDSYEKVGDISVTRLIRPPQITALEAAHEDELEVDVSDGLWMLLGQAMGDIIERGSSVGVQRERLQIDVNGWQVSGEFDIWYQDGVLKDYKVTSVWAFLLGAKLEWEQQLNLYRLIAVEHGYRVDRLAIAAILRDWNRVKAGYASTDPGEAAVKVGPGEPGYPPIPFMEREVPLWPIVEAEEFMRLKVEEHMNAKTVFTARQCSAEERWARPDQWATKKPGAKRATKLFTDKPMAEFAAKSQGLELEFRPGENVRCEGYCPVVRWCEQAKQLGVKATGHPSLSPPGGYSGA